MRQVFMRHSNSKAQRENSFPEFIYDTINIKTILYKSKAIHLSKK